MFKKGYPTEPGFYWQYWTKCHGPFLRQIVKEGDRWWVLRYNDHKKVNRESLFAYAEDAYWCKIEPPPFLQVVFE